MIGEALSACPHCAAKVNLSTARMVVPYLNAAGAVGERAEYQCDKCKGFSVLRPRPLGVAAFLPLAGLGFGLVWSGAHRAAVVAGLLVGALMLLPVARVLRPVRSPQG